jgi:2-polyprenyl-6-methoxyphenol hydroxylase-like FAD-dependent oxidoreductase
MESDVLIAGGGIGGMVLARALGERGWHVRILEREEVPAPVARPEILQQSTLAALEALGIGPRLRTEAAVPIRAIRIRHRDETLIRVDGEDLDAADVEPWSTDPAATRRLMLEAALATGNVERVGGAEVTDVVREGTRVVGVRGKRAGCAFEARGRLIVGDDGVRSVIRGSLGIRVRMRLFPLEFVTASFPRPESCPADTGLAWFDPGALRDGIAGGVFVPLPGDRMVATLLMPIEIWDRRFDEDPAAFWASLARLTPLADELRDRIAFPDDLTLLRRPYGHVPTYVADGAALIGDAAHPMSPAGGQGANAAIGDALALAEVADAALRDGDLSAARLSAYERRRRPANARSLRFTRRAVAFVRLGRTLPGGPWLLTTLVRQLGRDPARKRALLRQVATAFLEDRRRP